MPSSSSPSIGGNSNSSNSSLATSTTTTILLYHNFVNSIKSEATKERYIYCLNRYLKYRNFSNVEELLEDGQIKLIEANIIQYIVWLKQDQKLAATTVHLLLSAIVHFYSMNDVVLNRKKINMYLGEYVRPQKDRAYTTQEISQLLQFCDERSKALVFLLCSTGMRIGAVPDLQLRHLKNIEQYNLYQVTIYEGTREEYYSYTTPEAASAIDIYLNYRKRCGESLGSNSTHKRTVRYRRSIVY